MARSGVVSATMAAAVLVLSGCGRSVAAPAHPLASVSPAPSVSALPGSLPTMPAGVTPSPSVAQSAPAAPPAGGAVTTSQGSGAAAGGAATGRGQFADAVAGSSVAGWSSQVLVVVGSGSAAHVVLVERQADGSWSQSLEGWGHVGGAGIGHASESSSATPAGVWPLLSVFGTGPDPGAGLSYRQITPSSCYISDPGDPAYNTWQERPGCGAPNERMADYPVQYRAGLVIGYNQARTPGAGSAFFVHVDNGAPTAGCVSVPSAMMTSLVRLVRPGAVVANVTSVGALAAM